jgi:hypothetical protein
MRTIYQISFFYSEMMFHLHGPEQSAVGFTTSIEDARYAISEIFNQFHVEWAWDIPDEIASSIPSRDIIARMRPIIISKKREDLLKLVEQRVDYIHGVANEEYLLTRPRHSY